MAEVGSLVSNVCQRRSEVHTWILTENGYGKPVKVPHLADKTYAMFGTWGGATVVLEGGFDLTDPAADAGYQTLHESDNTTAISLTANGIGVVLENPVYIRPKISNVGTTSVKIVLVAR
jgi:hypothetical protein